MTNFALFPLNIVFVSDHGFDEALSEMRTNKKPKFLKDFETDSLKPEDYNYE